MSGEARGMYGREVAVILGISENTVRNWAASGKLKSYRIRPGGFRRYKTGDVEALRSSMVPSYHDLHITTAEIPRTSIFNLPYGIEVHVNRVAGWEVRDYNQMIRTPGLPNLPPDPKLLAGEYDTNWLVLDVGGHVICDSRPAAVVGGEQHD